MKKFLFYGASVTAQTGSSGYFDFVKQHLLEINCDAVRVAYGGCHIDDAGFYRLQSALMDSIDYVVFEWNTTGLALYNEFKLAYMLQCVQNAKAKPIFVILPQEATIEKNRSAENQIYYVCEQFNLPLLDVRQGLDVDKFKGMVRDVVHTNEVGAAFYADSIFDFIKKILKSEGAYFSGLNDYSNKSCSYLRSNSQQVDMCLRVGEILRISFKNISEVYSELSIRHRIGPFSPIVNLSDGVLVRSMSFWDSYCHYEREHFTILMSNGDFKSSFLRSPFVVDVSISDIAPKYELCRRTGIDFDVEKLVKVSEIYSVGLDFEVQKIDLKH